MKNYPEFDGDKVSFIYFVVMYLPSGTLYVNTSDRNITLPYDGAETVFYGTGELATISDCEVSKGTEAKTVKFSLQGIPSSQGGVLINENTRNKTVKAYVAVANSDFEMITDLILFFQGSIDSMSITADVSMTAEVSATSRLINWKRAVNSRYTNEDQLSRFPTDKGFSFVNSLSDLKLTWGSSS